MARERVVQSLVLQTFMPPHKARYWILNTSLGGTNHQIDLSNPDNLAQQSTDNGVVPNLKWSFSDSKARIFNGGWTREQVVTDLPSSVDISAAQQHLHKGASRELHWHTVVSINTNNDIDFAGRKANTLSRLSGVTCMLEAFCYQLLMRMGTTRSRNLKLVTSGTSRRVLRTPSRDWRRKMNTFSYLTMVSQNN